MPWWGKSSEAKETKETSADASVNEKNATTSSFDPNKLPKPEKLPSKLQKIVDKADKDHTFFDEVSAG